MALSPLTPTEMLKSLSFGLIGPSNDPGAPPGREPLDPHGQRTLNLLRADSELSPSDIAKQSLQGTENAQQTFNQGANSVAQKTAALGGNSSLNEALLNRMSNLYTQGTQRRKQLADLNAPVEQYKRMSDLGKVITNQAQANAAQARQALDFQQQIANQKAAMYGQLFSTAGTVGGFFMGGPMGASAGSQMGQNMTPTTQAPLPQTAAARGSMNSMNQSWNNSMNPGGFSMMSMY